MVRTDVGSSGLGLKNQVNIILLLLDILANVRRVVAHVSQYLTHVSGTPVPTNMSEFSWKLQPAFDLPPALPPFREKIYYNFSG